MSDLYEITCPDCGGFGKTNCIECDPSSMVVSCELNSNGGCTSLCPSCKGRGGFNVALEIQTAGTNPGPMNAFGLPESAIHYRYLTGEEVEEFVKGTVETPHPELLDNPDAMKCAIDFVITLMQEENQYFYKGELVKLVPKED